MGILSPVAAVLTWPVSRFGDVRRTWDVALAPSDARAVLRGAIGTDPFHLPVMEGIAASRRSDVVGSVDDEGRLQIYIGSKRASCIGLVGRVSACGDGSRIATRVAWIGLHWLYEPALGLLAFVAAGCAVQLAIATADRFEAGMGLLLGAMIAGGWFLSITSRARCAKEEELPAIFECLERVLTPHLGSEPPAGEGAGRDA